MSSPFRAASPLAINNSRLLVVGGGSTALELAREAAQCAPTPLPSGVPELDALLGGGFARAQVTELCGLAGAGKTQLCLAAAASTALFRCAGALVVCAKAGRPAQRAMQMLLHTVIHSADELGAGAGRPLRALLPIAAAEARVQLQAAAARRRDDGGGGGGGGEGAMPEEVSDEEVEAYLIEHKKYFLHREARAALSRVRVAQAFDHAELLELLARLDAQLEAEAEDAEADAAAKERGEETPPPAAVPGPGACADSDCSSAPDALALLVVDGLQAVVSPVLFGGRDRTDREFGNAALAEIGRRLRWIAVRYQVAVVVTNSAVLNDDREAAPSAAGAFAGAGAGAGTSAGAGADAETHRLDTSDNVLDDQSHLASAALSPAPARRRERVRPRSSIGASGGGGGGGGGGYGASASYVQRCVPPPLRPALGPLWGYTPDSSVLLHVVEVPEAAATAAAAFPFGDAGAEAEREAEHELQQSVAPQQRRMAYSLRGEFAARASTGDGGGGGGGDDELLDDEWLGDFGEADAATAASAAAAAGPAAVPAVSFLVPTLLRRRPTPVPPFIAGAPVVDDEEAPLNLG